MTIKFSLNNKEYPLKITYRDAIEVFPDKFGIDLQALFEGDNLDILLRGIMLNDSLSFKLLAHYVQDRLDVNALITELDQDRNALQRFKENWWEALLVFYGPLQRMVLKQVLEGAPSLIKKTISQQLVNGLNSSFSNTEEKQEQV